MSERSTLADVQALTEKWAPRFGFASYRFRIAELPKEAKGVWGKSVWLHDDDFFEIRVHPGRLNLRQMEALVIHELTHGLLSLAEAGREEAVCNRLAKLLLGDNVHTPNIWALHHLSKKSWAEEDKAGEFIEPLGPNSPIDSFIQAALPLLVDDLPPREQQLVNAVYYEGASLMEVARRLGISRRSAGRLHRSAMSRLNRRVKELQDLE